MGFYDHYAARRRNKLGERVKRYQARRIFDLGTMCSPRENPIILEIGPGDGYIAELASDKGCSYLAVEGSSAVARSMEAKGYRVINAMVPPLPEIDEVDVCYLLHVIEHMRDVSAAEVLLRSIRDRLAPGGSLVVACPDYVRWGYHFYDCDYTHQLPMTDRRLIRLLENEGYRIRYHDTYAGPLFGWRCIPLHWIARLLYPRVLDDILRRIFRSDIFYRAYLTIVPCLLVVATKDESTTAM